MLKVAIRQFRMGHETITKLINGGVVRAGPGPARSPRGGAPSVLVSASDLERAAETRRARSEIHGGPPADGQPIKRLARQLKLSDNVIQKWPALDPHPGLGRRIKYGRGHFTTGGGRRYRAKTLLASHPDTKALVDMVRDPIDKPIADNPGIWIAKGIFQHTDGTIFRTEDRTCRRYGIRRPVLYMPTHRKRREALIVVWPGAGGFTPWRVVVHSD